MLCAICGADAWYVCGHTGKPVCPQHSRIEIVSRLSFGSSDGLEVREATQIDCEEIEALSKHFREATAFNRFDKDYGVSELSTNVVISNSHIAGILTYALEADALVIIIFDVLPGYQGLGAGKLMIDAAKAKALEEGKSTILASASNDDLPAIYFYQRNGFQIYDVKTDLIAERQGELSVGFGGIPKRDEIRLRWKKS